MAMVNFICRTEGKRKVLDIDKRVIYGGFVGHDIECLEHGEYFGTICCFSIREHSTLVHFFLSASQPIVGFYSQPFSGLLASSFEVSRSHTTTRHSR